MRPGSRTPYPPPGKSQSRRNPPRCLRKPGPKGRNAWPESKKKRYVGAGASSSGARDGAAQGDRPDRAPPKPAARGRPGGARRPNASSSAGAMLRAGKGSSQQKKTPSSRQNLWLYLAASSSVSVCAHPSTPRTLGRASWASRLSFIAVEQSNFERRIRLWIPRKCRRMRSRR